MKPDCRQIIFAVLLIIVATVLSYSSVQTFEFNNYDDALYVTGNDLVKRGLTWNGVISAFTQAMAANWHPVTMVSHMGDVELFGLDAGAHHLVNAAFHLATSLLLFWVLFYMTRQLWPCAAVALLFAVHPLHVESVAWVAGRKDVLSGFFAMLTLWAYARYAARARCIDYVLVLLFFVGGLLSKSMLVTMPALLLLLDYWPLRRLPFSPGLTDMFPRAAPRRILIEKIPLVVLAIGATLATVITQNSVGAIAAAEQFPVLGRIANAVVSYVRYLGKTAWPLDLSFHYPHPGLWPLPLVVAALVFLFILTCATLVYARRSPWLAVGWLWFLISLLPVIGLIQVGSQAMADRYMYLPLIGLGIIAGWGIQTFTLQRPDLRFAVTSVALIALVALTFLTRVQSQHWKTSESLYTHALRLNGDNARAHELLARALSDRGDYSAAIRHYTEALRVHPRDDLLHYNLGIVLTKAGAIRDATNHLGISLQLSPTNTSTRYHLARCFSLLGNPDAAASNYLEVLKVEPNDYISRILLGHIYLDAKQTERALEVFSQAARQHARSPEAQHAYGLGLLRSGSTDEALFRFRSAIKLNPSFAPAHRHLAEALLADGKTAEAIAAYREAIRLKPDFAEAVNDLAWVLATHRDDRIRSPAEALELATKACQSTRYQQPVPLTTLAAAYAEAGRFDEAARTAERSVALARAATHHQYAHQAEAVLAAAKSRRAYRAPR